MGVVSAKTELRRRGVQLDPVCIRCGAAEETAEHAIRDCVWAEFYWVAGPLRLSPPPPHTRGSLADWIIAFSESKNSEAHVWFAMLLWAAWYARNRLVFQSKEMSHQECITLAASRLLEHEATYAEPTGVRPNPANISWEAPRIGTFKINTDASIRSNMGTGIGVIIRNHKGEVVTSLTKWMSEELPIENAEAVACREGIILARQSEMIKAESPRKEIFGIDMEMATRTGFM
ncbi:hypothetical protein DH2020_026084 [Rehmannia glutinosa]|uniref:RNase H type-1 domain-containing protein n=1 Tax=Rehmannia glutinosa TaxID=99300 RepID=A0ABR0W0I1_REHGL